LTGLAGLPGARPRAGVTEGFSEDRALATFPVGAALRGTLVGDNTFDLRMFV
jgi:hypothetical protein